MSGNSYRRRLKKSERKGFVDGWAQGWQAGFTAGHRDGFEQGKPFALPSPTEYASAVQFVQEFLKTEAELHEKTYVPEQPADWVVCAVMAARQLQAHDDHL